MRYIFNYKLFEKNYYEETSWTVDDTTITIKDVEEYIEKNNPEIISISVESIKDKCIHLGKTDKKTLNRSEKSDLSYPIIITMNENGEYGMILDGHHRLLKAINHKIGIIDAKVLHLSNENIPEEFMELFNH